jgi:hypothetical protein
MTNVRIHLMTRLANIARCTLKEKKLGFPVGGIHLALDLEYLMEISFAILNPLKIRLRSL